MDKKEKKIEWKKDFEVLFGDVDNKDAIKVFIQDLLSEQRSKAKPKKLRDYFTEAEYSHLYSLLLRNEEDGIYSGNREQYWKRHERIKSKLTN